MFVSFHSQKPPVLLSQNHRFLWVKHCKHHFCLWLNPSQNEKIRRSNTKTIKTNGSWWHGKNIRSKWLFTAWIPIYVGKPHVYVWTKNITSAVFFLKKQHFLLLKSQTFSSCIPIHVGSTTSSMRKTVVFMCKPTILIWTPIIYVGQNTSFAELVKPPFFLGKFTMSSWLNHSLLLVQSPFLSIFVN